MKRTLSLVLSAVVALGVLSGCSAKPGKNYKPPESKAPKPVETPVPLKVGLVPSIDALPFWVAEKNGYWQPQGLQLELVSFKSAAERDAALKGGQIEGMLADDLTAATLYSAGTKVQVTSLALGATKEESPVGIAASAASGITQVAGLKGVEIAVPVDLTLQYAGEKLLLENGFKPEEVKLAKGTDPRAAYDALMAGKVKAAVLPDPYLSMAITKGATPAKLVVSDAKGKQGYSRSSILFSAKAVADKADAVKRLYIAYNRAVNDIRTTPKDYMKLMVEKAGLPVEAAIAFPQETIPFSFAPAPKKADVESEVQWLLDKQIIKSKVTYEQLVNSSLLPQY